MLSGFITKLRRPKQPGHQLDLVAQDRSPSMRTTAKTTARAQRALLCVITKKSAGNVVGNRLEAVFQITPMFLTLNKRLFASAVI
jgi:hypothetical protein